MMANSMILLPAALEKFDDIQDISKLEYQKLTNLQILSNCLSGFADNKRFFIIFKDAFRFSDYRENNLVKHK